MDALLLNSLLIYLVSTSNLQVLYKGYIRFWILKAAQKCLQPPFGEYLVLKMSTLTQHLCAWPRTLPPGAVLLLQGRRPLGDQTDLCINTLHCEDVLYLLIFKVWPKEEINADVLPNLHIVKFRFKAFLSLRKLNLGGLPSIFTPTWAENREEQERASLWQLVVKPPFPLRTVKFGL